MVSISINQRFRLFREAIGAKRSEIADLLERTYQTVKDIEDGKSDIRVEHIKKLSEKYQLNPNWLLTGEGSQLLVPGEKTTTSSGAFVAGRADLSDLLDAICKALPDDQRHLCAALKKMLHALMSENDALKVKNMKILEDLNELLKRI